MRKPFKDRLKNNKCCLLINADPEDQRIFMTALYDVHPDTFFMLATDGDEALEMLEQCTLVPDCVFLEYEMKGIDGFKILRDLKKTSFLKHVPVVVHAVSNVGVRKTSRLLQMGAVAFCSNPYNYYGVKYLLHLYFKSDIRALLN